MTLDARQLEILKLLANGLSAKEIASELRISDAHYYQQLCRVRAYLRSATNEQMMVMAVKENLLP